MPREDSTLKTKAEPIKIGDPFGRLVVIEGPFFVATPTVGHPNRKTKQFRCKCECGQKCLVRQPELRRGDTKSCGCLHRESSSERAKVRNYRHGFCPRVERPTEYTIWRNILDRCTNPNSEVWNDYGGRGITVCDEWRHDFVRFYEDMGPRPTLKHQIDRRENNKGYSADNCRWVTSQVNNNNRRSCVYIEYDGQRRTVADWARLKGLNYHTLQSRMERWSLNDAMTKPVRKRSTSK